MLFHFFTALVFLDVVICSARIRHRNLAVEHRSFVNHQACGPDIAADDRLSLKDELIDRDDVAANLPADGNIFPVDVPFDFTRQSNRNIFRGVELAHHLPVDSYIPLRPDLALDGRSRADQVQLFYSVLLAMAEFLTHIDSIAIMYSSGFCG